MRVCSYSEMGSCVCVCEREKEKAANMTDIHFGFMSRMSDMLLVYVTIHVFFFSSVVFQ